MYQKQVLKNGLRVVSEEIPFVHSVSIGVWVRTGSRNETPANHGVSHMLEHLLFKGTRTRSAKQIAEAFEEIGGQLNAFTTKEYTCVYAKVLAEHLGLAMEILADMILNSSLDPVEIKKEKNVVLEEINMYEDSPDEVVHDLFAQTVWDGHPLGRAILGTRESIANLTPEIIADYYRSHYTAANTVVAVAGKITAGQVYKYAEPFFSHLPGGGKSDELFSPTSHAGFTETTKDTEQIQLCLGTPGLAQLDDRIYALMVLNNVLGGGLSSRLFQQIREERGLAYSVYSYHSTYVDSGLFAVYAATSKTNFLPLLHLTLQQVAELKHNGITVAELQRTQDQLRGSLLLSLENSTNRMMRLGKYELCYDKIFSVAEVVGKIKNVTRSEVLDLMQILFQPDKFSMSIVGRDVPEIDLPQLLDGTGL